MAAVPLATLSWLNRPTAGTRPIAETVFASVFIGSALDVVFIEGIQNWQAVWTAGAFVVLGVSLWRVRSKEGSGRRQLEPGSS
jgi:glucan 1,3-beta-glucosidase